MSTTIYCDHCGQPCGNWNRDRYKAGLSLPFGNFTADLCALCLDELLAFIGRSERYASRTGAM